MPDFNLQYSPKLKPGFDTLFGNLFISDDGFIWPNRLNLLFYIKGTVDANIGEYGGFKDARYTSKADAVAGTGFTGAGSATVTGLLTTDTITATGDVPTCTVDGALTFGAGFDGWDIYVHRAGVLWAYYPGINAGETTELDASGNGNHLTGLTTTAITERTDGTGTDYCNEEGFSERECRVEYSQDFTNDVWDKQGSVTISGLPGNQVYTLSAAVSRSVSQVVIDDTDDYTGSLFIEADVTPLDDGELSFYAASFSGSTYAGTVEPVILSNGIRQTINIEINLSSITTSGLAIKFYDTSGSTGDRFIIHSVKCALSDVEMTDTTDLVIVGRQSKSAPNKTPYSFVSMSVDAGTQTNIDYAYDLSLLADTYGQKITTYIQTQGENNLDATSWVKVADMISRGHEIGGHSRYHPHIGDLSGESLEVQYTGSGTVAQGLYINERWQAVVDGVLELDVECAGSVNLLSDTIDTDASYTADTVDPTYAGAARSFCLTEPANIADDFGDWEQGQAVISDNGDDTFNLTEDSTPSTVHYARDYFPNANIDDNTFYFFSGKAKANGRTELYIQTRAKDGSTQKSIRVDLAMASITFASSGIVSSVYDLGDGWVRWFLGVDLLTGGSNPRIILYLSESASTTYDGDGVSGVLTTQPKIVAATDIKTSAATFALDAELVYDEEITGCKTDLETQIGNGYTMQSWAWPHTSHDASSRGGALSRGVVASRGSSYDGANASYDTADLNAQMIWGPWLPEHLTVADDDTMVAEFDRLLTTLLYNNGCAQFYCHNATEVTLDQQALLLARMQVSGAIALNLSGVIDYLTDRWWTTSDSGISYQPTGNNPDTVIVDGMFNALQYSGPLSRSFHFDEEYTEGNGLNVSGHFVDPLTIAVMGSGSINLSTEAVGAKFRRGVKNGGSCAVWSVDLEANEIVKADKYLQAT
jgi:hypothetical protein